MTATKTPATVTPAPEQTTDYVQAWHAQSRTHSHVTYTVTYDRLYNEWHCQCPAWFYYGRCAHADAAMDDLVRDWREKAQQGRAA